MPARIYHVRCERPDGSANTTCADLPLNPEWTEVAKLAALIARPHKAPAFWPSIDSEYTAPPWPEHGAAADGGGIRTLR